jgi:hypothetical protein
VKRPDGFEIDRPGGHGLNVTRLEQPEEREVTVALLLITERIATHLAADLHPRSRPLSGPLQRPHLHRLVAVGEDLIADTQHRFAVARAKQEAGTPA